MNNLLELRKGKKLTQADVAKALNMSPKTYASYEVGRNSPDPETLSVLADYFSVTVDYLLGRKVNYREHIVDGIYPVEMRSIPCLGEIRCGEPSFAREEIRFYAMVEATIDVDFCLVAKGNSMIGARIKDGDLIFIKKTEMINNGEIAAVIIDDAATLKRVYYYPGKKLILQPENKDYEPLIYVGEELNQIRILGKVIFFQSNAE